MVQMERTALDIFKYLSLSLIQPVQPKIQQSLVKEVTVGYISKEMYTFLFNQIRLTNTTNGSDGKNRARALQIF